VHRILSTDENSCEITEKKDSPSEQRKALYDVGPIMIQIAITFLKSTLCATPIAIERPPAHAFFFYHPLCRSAVDSQPSILNSRDAKYHWNDCTRRGTFYFAWISSSSRREQSTSRSQVIVYRRLRVSSKFLRSPLSM